VAYADSSALVKLVIPEPESAALRAVLARWPRVASSALAVVEVPRAVVRAHAAARPLALRVLADLITLAVDDVVLERASQIGPPELRTFDAIHVASAEQLGDELGVVISYDERLLSAAEAHGFRVACPGRSRPGPVP
jgi:uncharacterized protein